MQTQEDYLSYHLSTSVDPTVASLKADDLSTQGVFFTWQDSWGEKPADADDYFYIVWLTDLRRAPKSTQADTLKIEDIGATVEDEGKTGEVIGMRPVLEFFNDVPHQAYDARYPSIAKNYDPDKPSIFPVVTPGPGRSSYTSTYDLNGHTKARFNILKRYPVSILEDAKERGVDLATDGLALSNSVRVTDQWASGSETSSDVTAKNRVCSRQRRHAFRLEGAPVAQWNTRRHALLAGARRASPLGRGGLGALDLPHLHRDERTQYSDMEQGGEAG